MSTHTGTSAAVRCARFFREWGWAVWSKLAVLTLLALFAQIIHSCHVFDFIEDKMRRMMLENHVVGSHRNTNLPSIDIASEKILVLAASSGLRIRELDLQLNDTNRSKLDDAVAKRLDGIRPIDRCALAQLLSVLAARLAAEKINPVIAIDIDTAPISMALTQPECTTEMIKAIGQLRESSTVIAITLGRESEDDRSARNAFMVAAKCTTNGSNDRHPLYFASPSFFFDKHSYPMSFPFSLKKEIGGMSSLQKGGSYFPSLGNLLGLQLQRRKYGPTSYDDTLTLLCSQASGNKSEIVPSSLLQDIVEFGDAQEHHTDAEPPCRSHSVCSPREFCIDAYEQVHFNWRWLFATDYSGIEYSTFNDFTWRDPKQVSVPLDNPESLLKIAIPDRTEAIILAVEGGGEVDRFDVPHASWTAVQGASLHALQAILVQDKEKRLAVHSSLSFAADWVVGLAFLLLWGLISPVYERMRLRGVVAVAAKVFTPLLIAAFLYFCVFYYLSPRLMSMQSAAFWLNPSYVLLGLLLHAYIEVSEEGFHHRHSAPDFTFGICPVACSIMSTRIADRRTQLIDAVLAVVFQWAIIGFAIYFLWKVDSTVAFYHRTRFIIFGLFVAIGVALLICGFSLRRKINVRSTTER